MNCFELKINDNFDNKSIDDFFSFVHLGKDKIKNIINNKLIFVNNQNVDNQYILKKFDILQIKILEKINIAPYFEDLDIIYEDKYLLIVNKPKNILIHSDENNNTLSNMVAFYYKQKHIQRNIRFVNRLDYETSGVVIFCKDFITEAYLDYLMRTRKIEKRYYAVCYNRFSNRQGIISFPIGRDRHNSKKMIVYKNGKEALTKYEVIKNGKISVCDINLLTGRTHQIRVHLSYLNHQLVGDSLYGNEEKKELLLQAYMIRFNHIFINQDLCISIPMEESIKEYVK